MQYVRLDDFITFDKDGNASVDADEMLRKSGFAVTPSNQKWAIEEIKRALAEKGVETVVIPLTNIENN